MSGNSRKEKNTTDKQPNIINSSLASVRKVPQGIDGSARKPSLRQDTGYMVEKTYLDIAPYLGAFGAYLMPQ